MPKPERSVDVALSFPNEALKRRVMTELIDWIETLDARLEWGNIDANSAYSFRVLYGAIPEEEDDGDEFGLGLFDTDLENEFDTELDRGKC